MLRFRLCVSSAVFFFKQKTAYEMRISDWSSDVCSSDLRRRDRSGASRGRRAADLITFRGDPTIARCAFDAANPSRREPCATTFCTLDKTVITDKVESC